MKKSLDSLNNLELLTNEEMNTVKGGWVMGTDAETFCEWYMGLTGQTAEEMMQTPMGQLMYQIDVALGLM